MKAELDIVKVLSIGLSAEVMVGELTEVVIDEFAAMAIGFLSGIVVGISVDMLRNMKVAVLNVAVIDLEFDLPPSYAVDVLTDAWAEPVVKIDSLIDARVKVLIDDVLVARVLVVAISGGVSGFGIVVSRDVNDENVVAAAMSALKFTISPSLEDTLTCC